MTKYAVAAMNFYDNSITIEFIDADDWKTALSKHNQFRDDNEEMGDISWMSDDIEIAKEDAFNADMMFDVVEVD
jgi:hypothetical protein